MDTYFNCDSITPRKLKELRDEYSTTLYVIVHSCGDVDLEMHRGEDAVYINTDVEDTTRLISWLKWHKVNYEYSDCNIVYGCSCQFADPIKWDSGICPCGSPSCDGTCDR